MPSTDTDPLRHLLTRDPDAQAALAETVALGRTDPVASVTITHRSETMTSEHSHRPEVDDDGQLVCADCGEHLKHRIRWYVYAGPDESDRLVKMPRTATMRGHWPGYDAECLTCGTATNTGGATRYYIEREIWFHKRGVSTDFV